MDLLNEIEFDGWYPINTVRKDYNYPVDLWYINGYRVADARWIYKQQLWYTPTAEYENSDFTHWRKIPTFPKK